jgi:transposase
MNLSKKGCSNHQERKHFLKMANCLYPLKGMTLIADREYVGRDWFIDLVEVFELNFVIRISETDYKTDIQNQGKSYGQMLKRARRGRVIDQPLKMGNQDFRMIVVKNKNPEKKEDDLIILITNLSYKKKKIIAIYKVRWQIECLFKCLKTNGFNMEDLSFKNLQKVRLLICIVIACYVLCVTEGLKVFKRTSKDKATKTKRESVFRSGYSLFCNYCQKIAFFLEWSIVNLNKPIRLKPV